MHRNMLRRVPLGLVVPLVLLGGCEMKAGKGEAGGNDMASLSVGEDGNVAITANDGAEGVSVSLPGFEGKMKIPGMELGGDNMDIDGMKLYPGSEVKGINVTDQKGRGNSQVEMRFTSPGTPAKVAAYYAEAARGEDYSDVKVSRNGDAATFTAKKADGDDLTIIMNPAAGGTTGQILIRGRE
jgi:hypothetical protein